MRRGDRQQLISSRNHCLDLIRGLAAVFVLLGHLRPVILTDWSHVLNQSTANKSLYFITGLGHEAVMIFFVLSGYLVGGGVIRGGFVWGDYLKARLSRLWTVLLPCLALTWVCDLILLKIAPEVISGGHLSTWHSGPVPGSYSSSLITALGNVFFLQTIAVPVFGSNGPLWSLANEFWYYILFPALLQTVGLLGGSRSKRVLAAVVASLIIFGLPAQILVGFGIWTTGALTYLLQARGYTLRTPGSLAGSLLLTASALTYSRVTHGGIAPEYAIGVSAGLLILACKRPLTRALRRFAVRLSDISFSLYLTHFPLVLIIGVVLGRNSNAQPAFDSWLLFVGCVLLILAIATAMWWAFERHTSAVRRWFDESLRRYQRGLRAPPL
jgi:peptidoglycan/LPS O-acetylase OafA/YrhL